MMALRIPAALLLLKLLDRGENNEFACSAQHPPAEPDRKRPVRPPPSDRPQTIPRV